MFIKIQTEKIRSIVIAHGFVENKTQGSHPAMSYQFRKQSWLKVTSRERHHLAADPRSLNVSFRQGCVT